MKIDKGLMIFYQALAVKTTNRKYIKQYNWGFYVGTNIFNVCANNNK